MDHNFSLVYCGPRARLNNCWGWLRKFRRNSISQFEHYSTSAVWSGHFGLWVRNFLKKNSIYCHKLKIMFDLFSVSLIRLDNTLSFNANVSMALVSTRNIRDNVTATISGWGAESPLGSATSFSLNRLTTRTITNEECRERFRPLDDRRIGITKICTFTQVGQGICTGDEGGALMSQGLGFIGVASWQVPCAIGYPDVFERLADKATWIASYVNNT